jgi:hypothetical protein|tara:strand:- start:523 stop:1281 length:759 start_codon:yes stop_codon:yes gene_type:complete
MKEEGKLYCDTSKLSVRKISKSVAKELIVKNHYSHLWTKVSYAIGVYVEDDSHSFFESTDKLIGVACYGDPIGRLSGQSISEELDRTEVLELVRLFVFDGYGSNIESWFLGQTFNWLRENVPHIKALISYSDPKEGHCGTIYQATNWLYQGDSLRYNDSWSFKFSEDGEWQHGRTIFPTYGTNNPSEIQKQVTSPFWIRKEPRKHRYVYILTKGGERRKLLKSIKHPILPYSKKTDILEMEVRKLEPNERGE